MIRSFKYFFLLSFSFVAVAVHTRAQAPGMDLRRPAAILPLIKQPAAKLIVDPPLKEPLQSGKVVILYYTENLRIVSVFGQAALGISPRVGHIHITVDDAPWHWADTSNEPIIIVGLKEGPHRILVELADPTHKVIDSKTVTFIVPRLKHNVV